MSGEYEPRHRGFRSLVREYADQAVIEEFGLEFIPITGGHVTHVTPIGTTDSQRAAVESSTAPGHLPGTSETEERA